MHKIKKASGGWTRLVSAVRRRWWAVVEWMLGWGCAAGPAGREMRMLLPRADVVLCHWLCADGWRKGGGGAPLCALCALLPLLGRDSAFSHAQRALLQTEPGELRGCFSFYGTITDNITQSTALTYVHLCMKWEGFIVPGEPILRIGPVYNIVLFLISV